MDELGDTPAFWHADDLMFWVREPAIGPGIQIVRGSSNDKSPSRLRMSNSFREDMRLPSIGFRPVLEFLVPPESVDDSFLGEALVVQNGTERLLGKLIEVTPYDLVLRAVPGSTLPKAGAGWFAKTVGEEHMIVVAREEIDDIIKW